MKESFFSFTVTENFTKTKNKNKNNRDFEYYWLPNLMQKKKNNKIK